MLFRPLSLGPDDRTIVSFGKPQETFFSQNPDYVPAGKDIMHLVESGRLIRIYYDYETTDKNAKYAAPWEFSARAYDLNGRLLARVRIPIAIPDHVANSIGAALVGRLRPEDQKKGWPADIAAAMIGDFFYTASRLDGRILGQEPVLLSDGKEKGFVVSYGRPDDSVTLEIHLSGTKFRFPGEEKWKRKIYGLSEGFNNESYDDRMASYWRSREGMADLFVSSQKRLGTMRADVRHKAIVVKAFGPQGAEGLQFMRRWHNKTQRLVESTRLGDILFANTSVENAKRGVKGGIRFDDGREYDPDIMHVAEEDATATAALDFHLRRVDPELMRFIESLGDAQSYKDFITGGDESGFNDRPLLGFVHYDNGQLTRGVGVLMDADDKYGNRKRALLFNLDHDPAAYKNLTDGERKAVLVQHHNNPPIVPLALNGTPSVVSFKRAYEAGAGNRLDPQELHRRSKALVNDRTIADGFMRSFYELTTPTRPVNLVTPRKPEDDSYITFGNLPRWRYVDSKTGKTKRIPNDIYVRAKDRWERDPSFDRLIFEATEAHAILYTDDPEAALLFHRKLKNVAKKLDKKQWAWARPFRLLDLPLAFAGTEDSMRHLWLLRHHCALAPFSLYPDFFVVNERGQRLSWDKVLDMPFALRSELWPRREDEAEGPHLRISFERDPDRFPILTLKRVFQNDAFNRQHRSETFRTWWKSYFNENYRGEGAATYEALVTLAVQGPPNQDPSEHVPMTEARALKEGEDMLNKAAANGPDEQAKSEYARQVDGSPLQQKNLADHMAYKRGRMQDHPWTPEKLALVGCDPETRQPARNPFYYVNPREMHVLRVPDLMLVARPGWNENVDHTHFVIAKPPRKLEAALCKQDHPPLILQGAATGMMRLAARATCARLRGSGDRAAEAVAQAQRYYAESALVARLKPESLRVLSFEQLAPLHHGRPVDESIQHVGLPSQNWIALVDQSLGGLPKPLGVLQSFLIRDVGQNLETGPIRLRRVSEGCETGDEYLGEVGEARRIHVDDIRTFGTADVWALGRLSCDDVLSSWTKVFADLRIADPGQQYLWHLKLAAPVDRSTYAFFDRKAFPVAVFDQPIPEDLRKKLFALSSSPSPREAAP